MNNDNEFLEEMENDKYVNQIEIDKNQDIEDKKQDKIDKKENKINLKISKSQKLEQKKQKLEEKQENKKNNESTEIICKNKLHLLSKISKYKKLFKTELNDYKINKNASEDELKNHITNIQDLLDSNEVDTYINDSIYNCIKLIEPFSSKTRYDLTGLSNMLKLNPQFDTMCKKLMLKYNCFSNTPIEYQMIMLVSTSVYLTIQMNKSKPAMEQFLNQKI